MRKSSADPCLLRKVDEMGELKLLLIMFGGILVAGKIIRDIEEFK